MAGRRAEHLDPTDNAQTQTENSTLTSIGRAVRRSVCQQEKATESSAQKSMRPPTSTAKARGTGKGSKKSHKVITEEVIMIFLNVNYPFLTVIILVVV